MHFVKQSDIVALFEVTAFLEEAGKTTYAGCVASKSDGK